MHWIVFLSSILSMAMHTATSPQFFVGHRGLWIQHLNLILLFGNCMGFDTINIK